MIMQDKLEKERNDAKNFVEEYVYEMRDKLHGLLEKFVTEEVSSKHLEVIYTLQACLIIKAVEVCVGGGVLFTKQDYRVNPDNYTD